VASRKVALVTGGGTASAKARCLALARAGYDVVVNLQLERAAARATPRRSLKSSAPGAARQSATSPTKAGVRSMLDSVKKTLGGSTC